AVDQLFDLRQQRVAAGVDRLLVQRGVAVEAIEAVARQNSAECRRYRDAPLRVEPQRGVGHEAVHLHSTPTGYTPIPGVTAGCTMLLGFNGLTWAFVGVNG